MKLSACSLPVDQLGAALAELQEPAAELGRPGRLNALRRVEGVEQLTGQRRTLRRWERQGLLQEVPGFRDHDASVRGPGKGCHAEHPQESELTARKLEHGDVCTARDPRPPGKHWNEYSATSVTNERKQ